MKELGEQIKSKNIKRCYLFWGKEDYLKKTFEDRLKSAVIEESAELMNCNIIDDKKIAPSTIIDMAQTQPFLSEKRVIIVKHSGLFQSGRKEETEKIVHFIDKIPESACIIFEEDEVDKRGKLYKAVDKFGYVAEFKPLTERELIQWISKMVKKNQLTIDAATTTYFIRYTGGDMNGLYNEMAKLADYKKNSGIIVKADINDVCIQSFEVKIFDLVAAIGNRKADIALQIYHNLLLLKESPIMILSMITRQFRLVLQSKILLDAGESQNNISQMLGQRDFVIRECLKQSRYFSLDILKGAMQYCLDTDVAIKTGKMTPELAVECLLLKYCNTITSC